MVLSKLNTFKFSLPILADNCCLGAKEIAHWPRQLADSCGVNGVGASSWSKYCAALLLPLLRSPSDIKYVPCLQNYTEIAGG